MNAMRMARWLLRFRKRWSPRWQRGVTGVGSLLRVQQEVAHDCHRKSGEREQERHIGIVGCDKEDDRCYLEDRTDQK